MRLPDIINYMKLKLFAEAQTRIEPSTAAVINPVKTQRRQQMKRLRQLMLLLKPQLQRRLLLMLRLEQRRLRQQMKRRPLQPLPPLHLLRLFLILSLLILPLLLMLLKSPPQKSHLKGWVTKVLPEDFLGELETLRDKWLQKGRSKLQIRLLTSIHILDMLKAHIQIKVENANLFKIIARLKN